MRAVPLEKYMDKTVEALGQAALFSQLDPGQLRQIAEHGGLFQYEEKETIIEQGQPSDSFFVMLRGEARVLSTPDIKNAEPVELAVVTAPDCVGEMGLLLGEPRTATVLAVSKVLVHKFDGQVFQQMFARMPSFGMSVARSLAARLKASARSAGIPEHKGDAKEIDKDALEHLNLEFITRHRVLPLSTFGNELRLGFVDDPDPKLLLRIRQMVPGLELKPVHINLAFFNEVLRSYGGIGKDAKEATKEVEVEHISAGISQRASLEPLLRRMVAEGASDLHLTGGERPRWRLDGEMDELFDVAPLADSEVYQLLEPVMEDRHREEFGSDNDTDFGYAVPGLARFRVNMFRDQGGVGAVLRTIPSRILNMEQLNLPDVAERFCTLAKGLVLVTGPTGSGKSTTLAAMVDWINRNRKEHIITLEDPIEFVHQSRQCLVNQREVYSHTNSFARALRAALREDPDIVLVGELRDLETMALALETASTGHLVFGTLHTSTAVSTVDRIIGLFPSDEQEQVRMMLSESLKGVMAQTLCRRKHGGRIAAVEILVANTAVAALIRDRKTYQLATFMTTAGKLGCQLLNNELKKLVISDTVTVEEAMAKAVDKQDLATKLGMEPPAET